MREERHPVLVGGGGLAGLSVGMFLGVHGIRALIVERHASTSVHPKARGQFPHTMEALRVAGVAERMVELSPPERGLHITAAESVFGPAHRELLVTEGREFGVFSPAGWANVSQAQVEPVLAARARELGAELRFTTELESFEQDDKGVCAVLREVGTGERFRVVADYLVAADGHRGVIREWLGIGVHGRGVLDQGIGAVFEADLGPNGFALWYLRNPALPGGLGVVESTDGANRYVINVGFDPERDQVSDFTPERWHGLIRIALGSSDVPATLVAVGDTPTQLAARVADRFSLGRVHLIGDAIRVMPPTGGMGGNTAILDAFYLAWKLAMVLHGTAGPGLLDSHDAERRPYSDILVEQQYAVYVRRLQLDRDDGTLAAPIEPAATMFFGYRHLSGAVLIEPDDDLAPLENPEQPTARPGSRAPHVVLASGLSTRDLFGRRMVVLAGPDGQAWRPATAAAGAALGLELDFHQVSTVDEGFAAVYGIPGDGAVLVRPDGFVAWRGADPAGLEQALRVVLDREDMPLSNGHRSAFEAEKQPR